MDIECPLTFKRIFSEEVSAIEFRRAQIKSGAVAKARKEAHAAAATPSPHPRLGLPDQHLRIERTTINVDDQSASGGPSKLGPVQDLTGLALSGGGIRSASFCLGVLQGLDSLSGGSDPHILDGIDYLSTVSGGGYIGTCLVAGLCQRDFTFPFSSQLDQGETLETKHLRNYANFLAPAGSTADYLASGALVIRGLLVNFVIVLPVLLILATITVALTPFVADLGIGAATGAKSVHFGNFVITGIVAAVIAVLLFLSAIYTSWRYDRGSLNQRERLTTCVGLTIAALLVMAGIEIQPFVLHTMFAATPPSVAGDKDSVSAVIGHLIPRLASVVAPAAVALIATAQRLANIAKAALGDMTWSGFLKKHASRIAIYLAAAITPFLLWVAYIYLSFAAVRVTLNRPYPHVAEWLVGSANMLTSNGTLVIPRLGTIGTAYVIVALVLSIACLAIGPNANSLHRLYRDRLSRAFLFARPASKMTPAELDNFKFSDLKRKKARTPGTPWDPDAAWDESAAFAPFLLVNTAINLEASKDLKSRGRSADVFTFSPLHVGSKPTKYARTTDMEAVVKDLTLPMAMATSGAAASANMGGATIKVLTFSLSLLNIRLGYWFANPARAAEFSSNFTKFRANIGTWYFAKETLGRLDERTRNVYLTDGGHVENLGIYALLKRRCKVILAVDAEGDQGMTFPSFVSLQVMARIDLGVRIDLPWQQIQKVALDVTSAALAGSRDEDAGHGPHAAIGRIQYDDNQTGILIYIKSSLTGDENDYILDYKRRNSTFPHESTADQFFTEEQFEAYRALGFHAARNLLTGQDEFAAKPSIGLAAEVAEALALLNVPKSMADMVVARL